MEFNSNKSKTLFIRVKELKEVNILKEFIVEKQDDKIYEVNLDSIHLHVKLRKVFSQRIMSLCLL